MIREQVKSAQVEAMKAGDKEKLAAVRLILAKLKDRDIELRTASSVPDDDTVVVDVLQKMVKQRRESIDMFKNGGRDELAAKEQAELDVIESFLPQQMSEDETRAAIEGIKAEVGAGGGGGGDGATHQCETRPICARHAPRTHRFRTPSVGGLARLATGRLQISPTGRDRALYLRFSLSFNRACRGS